MRMAKTAQPAYSTMLGARIAATCRNVLRPSLPRSSWMTPRMRWLHTPSPSGPITRCEALSWTGYSFRDVKHGGLSTTPYPVFLFHATGKGAFEKVDMTPQEVLHTFPTLNARDLLSLHAHGSASILVREKCFLACVENIKALVSSHSLVIFDANEYSIKRFAETLSQVLRSYEGSSAAQAGQSGLLSSALMSPAKYPFELRAIEHVLLSTSVCLEQRLQTLGAVVSTHLDALMKSDVSSIEDYALQLLLLLKNSTSDLKRRVRSASNALEDLLDSDEDMAMMQLTSHEQGNPMDLAEHEEVELMLEEYSRIYRDIADRLQGLESEIDATQMVTNMKVGAIRNRILRFSMQMNMLAVGLGSSALIAGGLGMNLTNHFEEHPFAFYAAAIGLFGTVTGVYKFLSNMANGSGNREYKSTSSLLSLQLFLQELEGITNAIREHIRRTHMGFGDKDQFRELVKKSVSHRTENEIDRIVELAFEVFDSDQDGVIKYDEILSALTAGRVSVLNMRPDD